MSMGIQPRDGTPILPGSPLARALDSAPAPRLSADFAERVIAAAEARPAPLPRLRRSFGWRTGRRVLVGLAGVAALASAAAATGLLQQFALPVPSAAKVWASLAAATAKAASARPSPPVPAETPAASAETTIDGPIDTPEELAEAFRRADALREDRRAERRRIIDQRIASEIERRRAVGLRVPTPEEEARLRERIAAAEARREQRADERIAARREALQRRVEAGEAITREDLSVGGRGMSDLPRGSAEFERLRRMPPRERRAALQAMSAEERLAIIAEFRALRAGANLPVPSTASPGPSEAPPSVPASP